MSDSQNGEFLKACGRSAFLVTVVTVLIGAAATVGSPAASAASNRQRTCSTKALEFSYTSASATFADKVSRLTTDGPSCSTARTVATFIAKQQLRRKSPTTIDGFTIHTVSPCSGCTPVWHVTATQGSTKIIFEVVGGA